MKYSVEQHGDSLILEFPVSHGACGISDMELANRLIRHNCVNPLGGPPFEILLYAAEGKPKWKSPSCQVVYKTGTENILCEVTLEATEITQSDISKIIRVCGERFEQVMREAIRLRSFMTAITSKS